MGNELFLNELPERDTNSHAVALSQPIVSGPLQTIASRGEWRLRPAGNLPDDSPSSNRITTATSKRWSKDSSHRLLGQAATQRVFKDGPHELGLKFTSSRAGQLTRIRYLRVAEEQGSHVGRLWDGSGRELARVAFTNETASGWQEAVLAEPVPIKANETYVVSVNANTAYAATAPGGAEFSRQDAWKLSSAPIIRPRNWTPRAWSTPPTVAFPSSGRTSCPAEAGRSSDPSPTCCTSMATTPARSRTSRSSRGSTVSFVRSPTSVPRPT